MKDNERLRELREFIYPILLQYYGEGETFNDAEKYAAKDWMKILEILSKENGV